MNVYLIWIFQIHTKNDCFCPFLCLSSLDRLLLFSDTDAISVSRATVSFIFTCSCLSSLISYNVNYCWKLKLTTHETVVQHTDFFGADF